MLRRRIDIIYFVLLLIALSSRIFATNYYVDKDATGSNNGTSWTNAWTTTSSINWNLFAAGDTVFFNGGSSGKTYPRWAKTTSWGNVHGGYVTFMPSTESGKNGTVTFYESGTNNGSIYWLYNTGSNARLKNFTVLNPNTNGSNYSAVVTNGDSVILDGLTVTVGGNGKYAHAIGMDGSSNFTIRNCIINTAHNTINTEQDAIICGRTTGNALVENNRVVMAGSHPTPHIDGIQFWTAGEVMNTVIIRNNFFFDASDDTSRGHAGIYLYGVNGDYKIYNNVVVLGGEDGWTSGISIDAGTYSSGTLKVKIFNNTVLSNHRQNYVIQAYHCDSLQVKNNIMYSTSTSSVQNLLDISNSTISTSDIDYNQYYKLAGSDNYDTRVNGSSRSFTNFKASGYEAHGEYGIANFVGSITSHTFTDYALQSGSNGIDEGTTLNYFNTDINDTTRPQNLLWDRGAFEFYTAPVPPTPPDAPTLNSATVVDTTSFTLNWNASSGATGYYLFISLNSSFSSFITGYDSLDVGNVTAKHVTGLNTSTNYYYRLKAYNTEGISGNSDTALVTTTTPPAPPTPGNITGTGTALDPYIFYNAADWDSLRYNKYKKSDVYIKLGNDIDFANGTWDQIDTLKNHIDGNNHTVSNLIVNSTLSYLYSGFYVERGMWGIMDNGSSTKPYIKNIVFKNCSLSVTTQTSSKVNYTALVLGEAINTNSTEGFSNIVIKECYLGINTGSVTPQSNGGMAFLIAQNGYTRITKCAVIKSKLEYNTNTSSGMLIGLISGSDGNHYAQDVNSLRYDYTFKNRVNLSNASTGLTKFGLFSGSAGDIIYNEFFAIKDTISVGSGSQLSVAGLINTGTASAFAQMYSTPIFITPTTETYLDFYSLLSGASGSNLYTDSTHYSKATYTAQRRSATDMLDSTKISSLNFTTYWDMDKTGIFDYLPIYAPAYMPTAATPTPADIPIALSYPIGGEIFFQGDTVNILFSNTYRYNYPGLDSVKIYYSTNAGTTWNMIAHVDTSYHIYGWIIPNISNRLMRIKVVDDDSLYSAESSNSFYILSRNAELMILSPTATSQTIIGNRLKIMVESLNLDYFKASYSKDTTVFHSINDSVIVNHGDGIEPDTTTFYWDLAGVNITGMTTIKVYLYGDSTTTGSMTDPYYGITPYINKGLRAHEGMAQSVNVWSDFYLFNDELYTLSFFGFMWGWYDYDDQINLYHWNKINNSFELMIKQPTPGASYYPYIDVRRTAINKLTMWNTQIGQSGYYASFHKDSYIYYPDSISNWSGNIYSAPGVSIDVGNTQINYNGWKYTLDPIGLKITAEDLNNTTNKLLLTDISKVITIEPGNVDFFVYDSLVMVSRRYGAYFGTFGSGTGSTVWIVGSSLNPNVAAAEDDVTFVLQGITRNYFRGVYPNAIIQYYPPIR